MTQHTSHVVQLLVLTTWPLRQDFEGVALSGGRQVYVGFGGELQPGQPSSEPSLQLLQHLLLVGHIGHVDQEYNHGSRFIHEELLRRCETLADRVIKLFRNDKRIYPHLLIWPSDTVRATDDTQFSGVIFTELSEDPALRKEEVKNAILRTAAFAALVTEQLETDIRMIFESGHGTRTWRLPIKNHGDIQILGRAVQHDNAESIGVLWKAN